MRKILVGAILLTATYVSAQTAHLVPDVSSVTDARQSRLNERDLDILQAAIEGTGLVAGCAITAQIVPDMTVAVAAGSVFILGTGPIAIAGGNVTISAADSTNPRWDLITSNASGTLVVTVGTVAISPKPPSTPATSAILAYVWVRNGATSIITTDIFDKRLRVANKSNSQAMLAADFTNSTTTFSNTALSVNVIAGRRYAFVVTLLIVDSIAADGVKVDFAGGTATATNFRAVYETYDPPNVAAVGSLAALTDVGFKTVITGETMFDVHGTFEPATSGTFIIRAAQSVHSAGTLTVHRGSWLQVVDIP